jgi:small GTP-binding protein
MSIISKKICLVGDFGVGKTSLIRRFVESQFSDRYLSTVGVKISRKRIETEQLGQPLSLQVLIWDIEGSTKYKAIAPSYLQGASGAVMVADLTRQETLDHLPQHFQLFSSVNPQSWMVLALNKADLVETSQQFVIQPTIQRLRSTLSAPQSARLLAILPTSAKTGAQVEALFQTLAVGALKSHELIR